MAKIVKFKNGQYAVRKLSLSFFEYRYLDLKGSGTWWPKKYWPYYLGSLEQVSKLYNDLTDSGTPV